MLEMVELVVQLIIMVETDNLVIFLHMQVPSEVEEVHMEMPMVWREQMVAVVVMVEVVGDLP